MNSLPEFRRGCNKTAPLRHFALGNSYGYSHIAAAPTAWHNVVHAIDVDDDAFYTAGDTLLIINYLNSRQSGAGPGKVPDDAPLFGQPNFPGYLDVDDDHLVTASDTILVINWLNSRLTDAGPGPVDDAAGEGESSKQAGLSNEIEDLLALLAFDAAAQPKRRRQ